MIDNILPQLAALLERRYREQRRAYLAEEGFPWPARRTRKHRPIPGAIDAADDEAG